eukprot:m.40988 g.40988  ORF g.40988 m.40988 type:complete len:597 (+) comp11421_c0_seq2:416-2206(+)
MLLDEPGPRTAQAQGAGHRQLPGQQTAQDQAHHVTRLILTPVPTSGRSEVRRELLLDKPQKIGRAGQNKNKPAIDNAVFDSKVLSRSHAEIWHSDGKVYVRDTNSSNGTFVNNVRLTSGPGSQPCELRSGDRLKLGVDVVETTASHKCVLLDVTVVPPDDLEDHDHLAAVLAAKPVRHHQAISSLIEAGPDALVKEIQKLRQECAAASQHQAEAEVQLADAKEHEAALRAKLDELGQLMNTLGDCIDEGIDGMTHNAKLVSRIATLEAQLEFYTQGPSDGLSGDTGQDTANDALRQQILKLQGERHQYEMAAKESVRRIVEEKHEAIQRFHASTKLASDRQAELEQQASKHADAVKQLLQRQKELEALVADMERANGNLQRRLTEHAAHNQATTPATERRHAVLEREHTLLANMDDDVEDGTASTASSATVASHADNDRELTSAAEAQTASVIADLETRLSEKDQALRQADVSLSAAQGELSAERANFAAQVAETSSTLQALELKLVQSEVQVAELQQQCQEVTAMRERLERANDIVTKAQGEVVQAVDNLKASDSKCKVLEDELKQASARVKLTGALLVPMFFAVLALAVGHFFV